MAALQSGRHPNVYLYHALLDLATIVPIQVAVFWCFGLYRGVWHFASLPDLVRIAKAVLTGSVAVALGGAGSIGSELCRQLARIGPSALVVLEGSEFSIYRLGWSCAPAYRGLLPRPSVSVARRLPALWMVKTDRPSLLLPWTSNRGKVIACGSHFKGRPPRQ